MFIEKRELLDAYSCPLQIGTDIPGRCYFTSARRQEIR
jgi:hypothetical protein